MSSHNNIKAPFEKNTSKILMTLFLMLFQISYGQNNKINIKGEIISETYEPIPYVSIVLKNYDNSILTGGVSDSLGKFIISGKYSGEKILEISSISYKKQEIKINCNEKNQNIGKIILLDDSELLSEAIIIGKEECQHITIEKATIKPNQTSSSNTGNIIDAIREISSITIDNNENISVRGNSNILILIDGIPSTIGTLNSIPSANTSSIDIISSPDTKYDAEGTGGIISITTKKQTNSPLNGIIGINYGFNNRINGNIALNHSKKKFNIGVNYNMKYDQDNIKSNLNRFFHSLKNQVSQEINSIQTNHNHVVGLNIAYKISTIDNISFNIKYSSLDKNNKQGFDNIYTKNNQTSTTYRFNDIAWNRDIFEGGLMYQRNLNKVNKLSIVGTYSQTKGKRPTTYSEDNELIQKSTTDGNPKIATIQGDLLLNKHKGIWETGIKMTYRNNHNDYKFYELSNNEWVQSDIYSNMLDHNEIIPALYFMYSSKNEKKLEYKFGLRSEYSYTNVKGAKDEDYNKKSNLFIAPNIALNYKIDNSNSISAIISRRITRPQYPQLIPYINMIDDKTFETGNKDLNPETISKIDLAYTLNKKLINLNFNLYSNLTNNYITQVSSTYKDKEDALLLTYINGGREIKGGIDINIKIKPIKYFNIQLSSNTYYSNISGKYNNGDQIIDLSNNGWVNNSNIALNILPYKDMDIQLQYFYTSPELYPQFVSEQIHYLNISIKQSLFKSRLQLSLLVTDVFNTRTWNINSNNDIYKLSNYSKNNSRIIWFGLNYKINNFKPKAKQSTKSNKELIKLGGM